MRKVIYSIKTKKLIDRLLKAALKLGIVAANDDDEKYSEGTPVVFVVEGIKQAKTPPGVNSVSLVIINDIIEIKSYPSQNITDFIEKDSFNKDIETRLKLLFTISERINKTPHFDFDEINIKQEQTLLNITDEITKELNQPLTTLLCNAEFLIEEAKENPSLLRKIQRISESGLRITESIKKIQALGISDKNINSQSSKEKIKEFKILLIEFDTYILKKLELICKKSDDIQIVSVNSFKNAYKKLSEKNFDLILTEEIIQDQTAGSFLQNIRIENIPDVIILTDKKDKHESLFTERDFGVEYLFKKSINKDSIKNIVSRVKEKARLEKKLKFTKNKLQELPMRDDLTGLYNKRWFFEILPKEMSRARRYKTGLTICIGHISEFKLIKEKLGYLSGDRLLTIISTILHSNSRKSDFCCRYDNQFAVVLPQTEIYGAGIFTGRIDDILKDKNFFYGESKTDINMDWGVCQFDPSSHPTAGAMVESAFSFQQIKNN